MRWGSQVSPFFFFGGGGSKDQSVCPKGGTNLIVKCHIRRRWPRSGRFCPALPYVLSSVPTVLDQRDSRWDENNPICRDGDLCLESTCSRYHYYTAGGAHGGGKWGGMFARIHNRMGSLSCHFEPPEAGQIHGMSGRTPGRTPGGGFFFCAHRSQGPDKNYIL